MQHAQMISVGDSVPKIVFGKLDFRNGQVWLPLAIHVHHGLCDGVHVGRFINKYREPMEVNS